MKNKFFLLIVIMLFVIPLNTLAQTYYWDDEDSLQMEYTLDDNYWSEDEEMKSKEENDQYDDIYKSDCGYLFTMVINNYDKTKEYGTTKQIDYHLFNQSSVVNAIIDTVESEGLSVTSHEIKTYKEFKYLLLKSNIDNNNLYTYVTMNNGNTLGFYYVGDTSNECLAKVDEVLNSSHSYIRNDSKEISMTDIIFIIGILSLFGLSIFLGYKNSKEKDIMKVLSVMFLYAVIIGAGVTLAGINYFQCTKTLNHGTCTLFKFEEGVFYALGYNSIILIGIILAFNSAAKISTPKKKKANKEKMTGIEKKRAYKCSKCGETFDYDFDICPKCKFDFSRIEYSKDQKNEVDNSFVCDNCGTTVSEDTEECPNCRCTFIEDEEEKKDKSKNKKQLKSNIDQKYSDLNKLKKLLDKDIITKEEFEKEKKKILKK